MTTASTLNEAATRVQRASTREELRAVVASARVVEQLHDWKTLRELQGLLPERMGWVLDRVLWNAGVRTVAELLDDKSAWSTLQRRCDEAERDALLEGLRSLVADAIRRRRLEVSLDDLVAQQNDRVPPPALASPREDLAAWASLTGVDHLLDTPVADALAGRGEPQVQVFLRTQKRVTATVANAIAGPTWPTMAKRGRKLGGPQLVQELCLAWLQQQGARAEQGRADESAYLAELADTAPDVDSLAGQDTALLALRSTLRKALPPLLALEVVPSQIDVMDEPRRLEIRLAREVDPACKPSPTLTIPLDRKAGVAEITCRCGRPTQCGSALQAVDAALRMLRTPGEQRTSTRKLLERPRWHHALASFEALAEEARRLTDAPTLGWRVQADGIDSSIEAVAVTPMKSGGFRTKKLSNDELAGALDASEQPRDARVAGFMAAPASAPHALPFRARVRFALRELIGHPRVFLGARSRDPADVRSADVAVVVDRDGEDVHLRLMLDGEDLDRDALRDLSDQRHLAGPPFLTFGSRVLVLRAASELGMLATLLLRYGDRLDADATEPVLEVLHRLEHAVPVELDETLRGESVKAERRLLVRLELRTQGSVSVAMRSRPLPGGPVLRPGHGRRFVHGRTGETRLHVQRDLLAERNATATLADALGLEEADDGVVDWLIVDPLEAAEAVAKLEGMASDPKKGPIVEWTGRPMSFTTARGSSLRVGVRSMEQWFGLEGALAIKGAQITLEQLIELLESGRRFVEVGEGDWVRIDESLARALEKASAGAFLHRGKRVISPLHAPALEGLTQAGVRIEVTPDWSSARSRIQEAATVQWTPPASFLGTLRGYQEEGARWLTRCAAWAPGCVLADDMGLGKTVQTLAVLASRVELGPTLVVAPASVGFNWLREASVFTPSLRGLTYRGPERAKLLDELGPGDLMVTSWSLLARDVERLATVDFGTVVFDEAQSAKNPDSARWAAARALKAPFRLALTGTPVENRPEDLWALFALLAPGLLGSRAAFRRRYAIPITRGEEPARVRLAQLVRPLLLRRLKTEVAKELPPRTEVDVRVQLGVDERRLYDEVRRTGLAALEYRKKSGQLRFQALALLTRLRQAACHPRLVQHDSLLPSAKLRRVRELVAELASGGHRALIFSQFLGHLALVREALEEDGLVLRSIDGSTPMEQRQREIDAFQSGDGDVFLISLKAGGVGLNLTAASYVFHLDPWWNPAVEDQATDRAYRIGQDKPVTVYRLIARDTVEESIVELHRQKRQLVDELLAGSAGNAKLGPDEIVALLEG
ncbi:MAG: DEAD/DEAH box helicase [Deltaproteobacteria bacterium]|nr:DEAD/DEAH box helicase [Deltaproteobacteria bacterium]